MSIKSGSLGRTDIEVTADTAAADASLADLGAALKRTATAAFGAGARIDEAMAKVGQTAKTQAALVQEASRTMGASYTAEGRRAEEAARFQKMMADGNVRAAKSVQGLSQAQVNALERARRAWAREVSAGRLQASMLSQQAAAQADLSRAQEMAALKADILARSEQAEAAAAAEATAGNTALAASSDEVAASMGGFRGEAHGATAAAMLLEGNTQSLAWSIGSLVEKSRILSTALEMAFPLIGIAAFISIAAIGAEKLANFVRSAIQVPKELEAAFAKMGTQEMTANDQIALTNARLQDQIAKLEGKPRNNLQQGLIEARVAADDLAASLQKDNSQMTQLIQKQAYSGFVGELKAYVTHHEGTGTVGAKIEGFAGQQATLGYEIENALYAGHAGRAKALRAQLARVRSKEMAYLNAAIAARTRPVTMYEMKDVGWGLEKRVKETLPYSSLYGRPTATLELLRGARFQLESQVQNEAAHAQNVRLKKRLHLLQAQHLKHHQSGSAATKGEDGLVAGWRSQLDAAKAAHAMTLPQQAQWWTARAQMAGGSPKAFAFAVDQAQKAVGSANEKLASPTGWRTANLGGVRGSLSLAAPLQPRDLTQHVSVMTALQISGAQSAQQMQAFAASLQSVNAQLATYQIRAAAASGRMTQLDAASAIATIHQREYAQGMAWYHAQIRAVQSSPASSMTARQRQSEVMRLEMQRARFQTQSMQVAQRDAMATGQWRPGSTIVAVRNALDEFVLAVRNTSGAIASIVTGTVTGVNRTLSGAIMAHSYNAWEWRQHILNAMSGQMRSAGARGLDVAMSGMEGGVLKAFGFGPKVKRGDSPTAPIYTIDVGAMKGAGSAGAALGKIASATAKHGVGGFFGSIFQGFFANGGTVLPGMPAIVGERGPELFVPHSAGRIVPNNQLMGNVTHHYHIDARGATDPAAVEMAVHRAIGQAAPHIVAASVQAVHEHHSRIPTNRRY